LLPRARFFTFVTFASNSDGRLGESISARCGGQDEIDNGVLSIREAGSREYRFSSKFGRRIFRRTILFLGNDSPSVDERRCRWPRSRCPPDRLGVTCYRRAKWRLASWRTRKYHSRWNARRWPSPARGRRLAERGYDCCWGSEVSRLSFWPSYPLPRMISTTPECEPRDALTLKETEIV